MQGLNKNQRRRLEKEQEKEMRESRRLSTAHQLATVQYTPPSNASTAALLARFAVTRGLK